MMYSFFVFKARQNYLREFVARVPEARSGFWADRIRGDAETWPNPVAMEEFGDLGKDGRDRFWEALNRQAAFACIPLAFAEAMLDRTPKWTGIVVRASARWREPLLAAVLGVAREQGLCVADPLYGIVLFTPEDPALRPRVWLQQRKKAVIGQLQRAGRLAFHRLWQTDRELCYIAFHWEREDLISSKEPKIFLERARAAVLPDERLECHAGRVVISGPEDIYRLQVNWEGRGKHASWIPDFRELGCPMVQSHRASYRMALRGPEERSLVVEGMDHPAVAASIPDPLDRFVSLRLANHRLTDRVPREVVEELKKAKAGSREQERP